MASNSLVELRDHLLTLGDDTKAIALAIGARAALRTIPLLQHLSWDKPLRKRMRKGLGRPRMSNSEIVLGTFRCAATAWVTARFPAFGMSDHFHEIKHAARMAGGAEDAGATAASYAPYAAHNAMMVALAVFEDRHRQYAAMSAGQTVGAGAIGFEHAYAPEPVKPSQASRDQRDAVNRELSGVVRIMWDAAWSDIRRLGNVGNSPQSLLMQALWLTPPRRFIQEDWRKLSERLLERTDEHWGVWIDWYEAQLAGPVDLSEREEIERVSLPNHVWAQGAAFVNGRIFGHVD